MSLKRPPFSASQALNPSKSLPYRWRRIWRRSCTPTRGIYENSRVSTRVKDLVDMAVIAHRFRLDSTGLRNAIDAIFAARATHPCPSAVPPPPAQWRPVYRQLAVPLGLDGELTAGHRDASALFDPVLGSECVAGTWDPARFSWRL